MKKAKKLLAIGLSIFFLFGVACIAACQTMADVVPQEYGEWDNNYVYRGNGRSKTTGEDYEQLVDSVEIEGENYTVLACADFEIKGDNMYMVLACQEAWKNPPATQYTKEVWEKDFDLTYCLAVYNIADKTQKVLTTDTVVEEGTLKYYYRLTDVEVVLDEAIVLRGVRADDERFSSRKEVWYTVDLEGNMLNPCLENGEEWAYYEWFSDEYLVGNVYNTETELYELSYRKGDLSEPVIMFTYSNRYNYSWAYVEENGVQGVLFQKYYRSENKNVYNDYILSSIEFYNFATNKKSEIFIDQRAEFFGNYNYLRTRSYQTIEYTEFLWEKKTAKVETDNALYRIVYDENGIHLEEFFDLTEKHNYTIYEVHEDKLLYWERWYQDAGGCNCFGGSQTRYVIHDLASDKITEIEFEEVAGLEDEWSVLYEKEKGIVVGQYTYFLHEEEFKPFMGSASYGYLLKRVNNQTNEVEVMQCWHEDKGYDSGELTLKYCEELWFTCGSYYNQEFNFYEFTVRAY